MKVKVLTQFHDKDNYAHIYEVGEIIEFDDTRANSLISRKLVKSVESAEQKETKSEAEVATSQGVAPKPKDEVKDVPTDTPNANEAEVADNADNAEKAEDVDNAEKADNADNADNTDNEEKAKDATEEKADEADKVEDATKEKADAPKRGRKAKTA